MTTRLPADQRRRQLLDTACRLFADRGFHASAMDEIARAAGVTKPVLYQHFTSKRALFVEVLDDVGGQLMASLGSAAGEAPTGRDRVQAGFAAYFRFVTGNEPAFRVLFGAAARNDPEFAAIVDGVLEDVADAISNWIEIEGTTAHRRVLAHAVVGMAEATSRDALSADGLALEPDRLAAWVAELAWFGLRGVRAD
ncbi:MAG: TetR/AcrR family transcriptional regulator [Actinobacteria bacterium]|nr:TetR/AcrR family transcriptional regulator [Actinomycetota bacterium]